jgi:hypothetical protein
MTPEGTHASPLDDISIRDELKDNAILGVHCLVNAVKDGAAETAFP